MTLLMRSKRALVRMLYNRTLNPMLTAGMKVCAPLLPEKALLKTPIFGVITCNLNRTQKVFLYSDGDDAIASLLYFKGMQGFESSTMQLLLKLLTAASVVLDIGANTGIYALIAAAHNPKRQVHAFEPVPQIYTRLKKNVELNNLGNLTVNASAVSHEDGTITLYIPTGSLHIPTGASTQQGFRQTVEAVTVEAITLDSYVAKQQIAKVDLIKVDTETTEPWVLAGARKTIERDQPLIICEVLAGTTESQLHAIMDPLQYCYFWITERGLVEKRVITGDSTYENMNYLFVPAAAVDKVAAMVVA